MKLALVFSGIVTGMVSGTIAGLVTGLIARLVTGLVIGTVLLLGPARAEERFEFYNGVRALGMGGATVATVNDETALLSNPAGLGRLRDTFLTIADPEIDFSSATPSLVGTDTGRLTDINEALSVLNQNPGEHLHARTQVFPSIVTTNFGLGLFVKYSLDAEVEQASTTTTTTTTTASNFRLDYTNDTALVLGYNFRIWDGILKLGFNGRLINRSEVAQDLNPRGKYTIDELHAEGLGMASDVGLILTAPWVYLPTLAAVWRDVGNTKFDFGKGIFDDTDPKDPRVVEQTVDVGFSVQPILGKKSRWTLAAEYRDVLTADEEEDHFRRIHVGAEVNLADVLFLRAGMNQRYWTAGLEFASEFYQLQAATYGEEIGTSKETREDRRYVLKFSFRF